MKPVISYEGDDGERYDTDEKARDASIRFHVDRRLERLWPGWSCMSSSFGETISFNNPATTEKRKVVSENFAKICECLDLEIDLDKMRDYTYPHVPIVPDVIVPDIAVPEKSSWWQRWRKGDTS